MATLTCDYLNENNKEWPSGWDDLEPYAKRRNSNSDAIDRMRDRVDFDFSPEAFKRLIEANDSDIPKLFLARTRFVGRDSLLADRAIFKHYHSASSANSAVNQNNSVTPW